MIAIHIFHLSTRSNKYYRHCIMHKYDYRTDNIDIPTSTGQLPFYMSYDKNQPLNFSVHLEMSVTRCDVYVD